MLVLNFDPFPLLQTERLQLRCINTGDVKELLSLRSNAKVMEFLDRPAFKSEEEAMKLLQQILDNLHSNDGVLWAICEKGNSKMIGTICYWRIAKENYRAEIGYMLSPDLHGKGIMQEAMVAVLDYGFNKMNLHSIEADVNPNNEASIRLLEKNHFVREAYFRENIYYNGKFLDTAIYSLLAPPTPNSLK